jgi:hypothetical protein
MCHLTEFKECVSDTFGPGQPSSQSQPTDGGERSGGEEPRLLKGAGVDGGNGEHFKQFHELCLAVNR